MMTMIDESVSFSHKLGNICRLCLKDEGPMSSIFTTTSCSENENLEVLAAKITSIAQVQISPTDGLPATVCHMCRQQVDKFYDFRILVEISDRTLRSCFDDVQDTSDFSKIIVRSADDDEDANYEESSEDRDYNEKDLLSVNAILVPSTGGMQVWQICNIKEEEGEDEEDENEIVARDRPNDESLDGSSIVCQDLECSIKLDDSDLDDLEGVKRCLARTETQLAVKPMENEDELYLATATIEANESDEEQNEYNEQEIHFLIEDDEDNEEHHPILEKYSCQLCQKSFRALDALKNHVSDHFLPQKPQNSISTTRAETKQRQIDPTCSQPYDEVPELDSTDNDESREEFDYPDSIALQSSGEDVDSIHDKLPHSQKNSKIFNCKHCDKTFSKQSSRKYHVEINHRSKREKTHKCNECDKEFVKRYELTYHKGTHTKSPLLCTICNKGFRNVQSFKMHWKRHTLGSRYNCTVCGKSYYTNSELARHAQQHTGLRGYPCELCNMSFLSKPELNRHVKYHNGVKKWECKICLKTYYESGHLKVHERVHTGERPFACTVCEKGFITKSKLVRHLKIHARNRQPGIEPSSTPTNVVYTY